MIGYHATKKGYSSTPEAVAAAFKHISEMGFKKVAVQIFATGPQNYHKILSDSDIMHLKSLLQIHKNLHLIIHGAYVDNPWNKNLASVLNICEEARMAAEIGAQGVIVHLSKGANDPATRKFVVEKLCSLPDTVKSSTRIWFEINAAKPNPATTFEKPARAIELLMAIHKLINEIDGEDNPNKLQIGYCIDTAHLFSCGVLLQKYDETREYLAEFDNLTRAYNIPIMFHLNDSASKLGSGVDRHDKLAAGNIWGAMHARIAESGIAAILHWAQAHSAMIILERDLSDSLKSVNSDLTLLYKLGV